MPEKEDPRKRELETRSRATEAPDVAEALPRPGSDTGWSVGSPVLDRYVVEGELGRGGMGVVHALRNRETGQIYAVKRSQKLDEAHRRRFLRELQTWKELPDHPNLVRCYFFKTIGDQLAIFAELIDGQILDVLIRRGTCVAPIRSSTSPYRWPTAWPRPTGQVSYTGTSSRPT